MVWSLYSFTSYFPFPTILYGKSEYSIFDWSKCLDDVGSLYETRISFVNHISDFASFSRNSPFHSTKTFDNFNGRKKKLNQLIK